MAFVCNDVTIYNEMPFVIDSHEICAQAFLGICLFQIWNMFQIIRLTLKLNGKLASFNLGVYASPRNHRFVTEAPYSLQLRATRLLLQNAGNIFSFTDPLWGESTSKVDSPLKDQLRANEVFSLICGSTNESANNRNAGDLRRHRAYNDVIVIYSVKIIVRGTGVRYRLGYCVKGGL